MTDMLHLTWNLNRRWDQHRAKTRLTELNIPLDRKVGKLSGGLQAQLALTLALARRPGLLILDEPLVSTSGTIWAEQLGAEPVVHRPEWRGSEPADDPQRDRARTAIVEYSKKPSAAAAYLTAHR